MSETPPVLTRLAKAFDSQPPILTRILVVLVIVVAGVLAGWIGRGVLVGPPDTLTMTVYKDWRVVCPSSKEKNQSCEITQDVMNEKAGGRIARVALSKEKGKALTLYITVPLEVLLEPGLVLRLGDVQTKAYQYKTCTEDGCIAVIPVDDTFEASFVKTQAAAVIVTAPPEGKNIEIPFSMKGFVEAHDAFLSGEAKRNSWWRRLWL